MNQRQREVRAVLGEEIARAAALEASRHDGGSLIMADVSYAKTVAGEPAVAEAAARSSRRWMPGRERLLGIAHHRRVHCDLGDRLSARPDADMGLPVALESGPRLSGADRERQAPDQHGRQRRPPDHRGVSCCAGRHPGRPCARRIADRARGIPAAVPAALPDPRHCLDSALDPVVRRRLHVDGVRDLLLRHLVDHVQHHDRRADAVGAIHRRGAGLSRIPQPLHPPHPDSRARCPTSSPACG